jgi:hypothetical protein
MFANQESPCFLFSFLHSKQWKEGNEDNKHLNEKEENLSKRRNLIYYLIIYIPVRRIYLIVLSHSLSVIAYLPLSQLSSRV